MPPEDHDVQADVDCRPREKQRRSRSERKPGRDQDRDRDRDGPRDGEHKTRRSSKTTRTSKNSDGGSHTHSHSSTRRRNKSGRGDGLEKGSSQEDLKRPSSMSDMVSGMAKTSLERVRSSMPYPSFSKAHSREAIVSREDVGATRRGSVPLTPEPTDVGEQRSKSADVGRKGSTSKKAPRPPSPPETDVSAGRRREDQIKEEDENIQRPKSRTSGVSQSPSRKDEASGSKVSKTSSQATFVKMGSKSQERLRTASRGSSRSRSGAKRSSSTRSPMKTDVVEEESPASSIEDSSPRTPTQAPTFHASIATDAKARASPLPQDADDASNLHSKTATPASTFAAVPPPPPPPPPPALDIQDIPRVDYLLQNGGLPYPAPKQFLSVLPRQNGTRPSNPPLSGSDTLFAPFFNLLEQYNTVLNKQGSVAVATGHRSVARRLLDRLENVFSRDLPAHGCSCVMCEQSHEIHRGLNWGDVLEWVSGRIELPNWPPFDLANIGAKAAEISAETPQRPASPVKLDPDIAEEFREHYLRQSKKVRSAVDKWLTKTGETPAPPPQEVDDETLVFAILTNMEQHDRPFFNALITGAKELRPATRAPTPMIRTRNDFIIKTGIALQRLYRLQQVPRDAETASYLVKNPQTHDLLNAMSNINNSEWEILTSGRFDGFLWSGADADDGGLPFESRGATPASGFYPNSMTSPSPRVSSAMGSRNTTPFSMYSRGTTPASFVSLGSAASPGRQPVSNDEEMEMAAIAELEREIYTGMESLEDAFEKLHHQAEVVRNALRQRGAGLMQNLQNRRRIDVLPTHPTSGDSQNAGYERPYWAMGEGEDDQASESEWGMDDTDIMPDDSASNISSSRHRRPKRRTERRTPAPIEEEDER